MARLMIITSCSFSLNKVMFIVRLDNHKLIAFLNVRSQTVIHATNEVKFEHIPIHEGSLDGWF